METTPGVLQNGEPVLWFNPAQGRRDVPYGPDPIFVPRIRDGENIQRRAKYDSLRDALLALTAKKQAYDLRMEEMLRRLEQNRVTRHGESVISWRIFDEPTHYVCLPAHLTGCAYIPQPESLTIGSDLFEWDPLANRWSFIGPKPRGYRRRAKQGI